jgi:hypothetical protein
MQNQEPKDELELKKSPEKGLTSSIGQDLKTSLRKDIFFKEEDRKQSKIVKLK